MKRARAAVLAAMMAAATGAMASQAWAQGESLSSQAPAESEAMTEKARDLYNEGRTLYGKGHWEKAHASFLAAWSLKKHWQIAGMLGHCELQMGRYREAARHLSFSIRTGAGSASQKEMTMLRETLDRAKREVGTIQVQVDTDAAEVRVNGQLVGRAPLFDPIFVEPDSYTFQARTNERASSKVKVHVEAGGVKEILLRVDQVVALEHPKTDPPVSPAAPVGEEDAARAEKMEDGADEGGSAYPILFATSGAVFVAGTVLGSVFWSKASTNANEVDDLRKALPPDGCLSPANAEACSRLTEARDDYDTNLSRRNIAFVVGGVGLVAAGVTGYFWVNEGKSNQAAIHVLPFSNGSATGIAATGSF